METICCLWGMSNLGAYRLASFRVRNGDKALSRQALAKQLGVTPQYLGLLERGERTPGLTIAAKLAELGVCEPADWVRPAVCGGCSRHLTDARNGACTRADCGHPERQSTRKEAA